ncbi:MAG: hypothetical protein ACE5ER_02205 [Nitrospinaceae bacterium]
MIRFRPHHPLQNESGIAAIMLVVFSIIILASIGLSFFVETQQKQQGAALGTTSTKAYMAAESGLHLAEKCLTTHRTDANCPCNSGPPNDCGDYPNLQNFAAMNFAGGQFTVTFSNQTSCTVDVTSTGTAQGAAREVRKTVRHPSFGGIGPVNPMQAVNNRLSRNVIVRNYTVPGSVGTDLLLVAVAGARHGNGTRTVPQSATFGGAAMTKVTFPGSTFTTGGGADTGAGMFFLAVTPNQTGNVVARFPQRVRGKTLHVVTLKNVLNTGPEAVAAKRENLPVTSITDNITTLTNNAMVMTGVHQLLGSTDLPTPVGSGHTIIGTPLASGGSSSGAIGRVMAPTAGAVNGIGFASTAASKKVQLLASFAPGGPCS